MAQVLYYTLSFLVIISTLSNFLVFGETDSSGVDQLQFSISGKPKVPFLKSLLAWSNKQAAPVRALDAKTTSNQPAQRSQQDNAFVDVSSNVQALLAALARKGETKYFTSYCSIGVKDGRVVDADMSASSSALNFEAKYARYEIQGRRSHHWDRSAWIPAGNSTGEWLQIDLEKPTFLTGIVTLGRNNHKQWVKSYKLAYGNFADSLKYVKDKKGKDIVFRGNPYYWTPIMNRFDQPITARYIRFYPITWHNRVAVRMELINC